MSQQPLDAEKLVEIHKARDEGEGSVIIGFLQANGVEASFQGDPAVSLDLPHMLKSTNEAFGVYVLEHEASKARELVKEFVTTVTDQSLLEEAAAQKLRVDKETITRLRGALIEERETFEFLRWIGVVFFTSAAVLWMIWPDWLKLEVPSSVFRWLMVLLLLMGALFASRWSSRHR